MLLGAVGAWKLLPLSQRCSKARAKGNGNVSQSAQSIVTFWFLLVKVVESAGLREVQGVRDHCIEGRPLISPQCAGSKFEQ